MKITVVKVRRDNNQFVGFLTELSHTAATTLNLGLAVDVSNSYYDNRQDVAAWNYLSKNFYYKIWRIEDY